MIDPRTPDIPGGGDIREPGNPGPLGPDDTGGSIDSPEAPVFAPGPVDDPIGLPVDDPELPDTGPALPVTAAAPA